MSGPAWSGAFEPDRLTAVRALPLAATRAWAWDGATGAGVKVAIIDSGIDAAHPLVGAVDGYVAKNFDRLAYTRDFLAVQQKGRE